MDGGETLRGRIRRAKCAVCVLAAVVAVAARAQDAASPEPIPLREGQTLTTAHGAAERFTYIVEIADAQMHLLRVDQRGLDLIVTVETPAGSQDTFDSPLFRDGSEFVVLGPSAPGRYRITLHCEEHTGARGGHTIALSRLTPAANADELEAWRLMSQAGAANGDADEQGWATAVEAYERAADIWRETGRTREQADALFAGATIEYWQRFNWERSAEVAASAALLYEGLGDAALAANALHLQGAALVEQALETKQSATSVEVAPETEALFTEALALLERARATHEQLGNVYELGLVTNNFGYTHYNKGEFARARGYFEQAAASMRGINEWRGELSPLSNLGALDIEGGHLAAAAKAFERILAILPEGKLPSYRGTALENLGVTQGTLGDLDEALRLFSSVLDIRHQLGERQGEGRALARIGATYYALGELDLATEFLQQALPIAIRSNDGRGQEAVLRSLGNIAYLQGDYETAIRRHRLALEVAASTADRTYLQQLIAKDLIALGRYDEAKDLAAQAQAGAVSTGSEPQLAAALRETGRALLFSGDAEGAVSSLKRAEEIFARLNLRGERAEVMHGLALATRELNRFDEAVLYGEASVAELEKLRLRVADPELRAFFSAARRDYYETQIDSLMKLHARSTGSSNYLHAALETSERSRARMIADLLQEASIDLRAGVDPSFQARQTELYAGLAEQRHQRDALLESRALSGNETSLQEVLGNLATIENDLNLLEIELRRSDPRLASMSAPAPLAVDAIQALIDDDTVLLQYALGAATSYVWIVTSDDVVAVELAGRVAIEGAARRVLESLRIYDPTQSVSDTELADLAELVLAPVAKHLQKRTIVVALDGALQYVPFSVLPVHGTNGSAVPLLADHNVVAIPSMSALVVPARESVRPATRTLAVFADPVVEATDPRFGAAGAISAVPPATSVALVTRSSTATLGRLPSTGYEAEAISALVPEAQRFVARGFSANREAVLSADLSRYQYLHFATHGLVDSRYPGLSALAFSQFDSHGTPQDGYLRLHDIYDLELRADLVVLSACETALGREVRGEGLIGLTQGFMYAGARSVVASLWQVPDRATAELMTRFYSFMLNDGMRPVEALRQAQLAIASERRWSNPYFWGGFVLLGDWR